MTLSQKLQSSKPKVALILGSALGAIVDAVQDPLIIPYTELSGFPVPKISGHAGKLYMEKLGGPKWLCWLGEPTPMKVVMLV